jgi:transposase
MRPFAVRSGVGKVFVVPHSVEQVADMFGVHYETAASWIRRGELAAVNISESASSRRPRYVVTEQQLAAFIERRSTVKASPASKPTTSRRTAQPLAGRDYVKHYEE